MFVLKNLIDGDWREGESIFTSTNPSDLDEIVAQCVSGSADQVMEGIAAAKAAFAEWSHSPILLRHDLLMRVASELREREVELGRLASREQGKTLREATGEVVRAAQIFEFFAGECLRIQGEKLASVRPNVEVDITREPLGVIGLITPWNIPIAIPAWKIAPALAYGNCIVFKPAELVSATAWHLVDIIHRAGVPKGVLNLIMGSGRVIGSAIAKSPDIDGISFTGSTTTGRTIATSCAEHGTKLQMEMGGKNPLVVLADADMDIALDCAIDSAFFATGQRCTAASRLIVEDAIHDHFVQALIKRMKAIKIGHALDPASDIGPVVSEEQLEQNLRYIDIGQEEGATLAFGGGRIKGATRGCFMQPALFSSASNGMRICQEEIFGPVAAVIRVADYDEALQVANDTQFGLSAGICTRNLEQATHFRRNVATGVVAVNLPTAGADFHVPFGGRKASSLGPREQGRSAIEFYTTTKTSYLHC